MSSFFASSAQLPAFTEPVTEVCNEDQSARNVKRKVASVEKFSTI
jgi:hypothetical protein